MLVCCQRGNAFFPVKEWKVVVFIFLVFTIFSPPRALFFISHPHTSNRWGFYLSSQLSISPSSFLLFLSPPIRPRLFSSSLPPSVSLSLTSRCQRMEAATAGWSSRVHRLMILGCVLSSRVSSLSHGRVHVLPCFINTWETLSFSLLCLLQPTRRLGEMLVKCLTQVRNKPKCRKMRYSSTQNPPIMTRERT